MRLQALAMLVLAGTLACDETLSVAPSSEVEEDAAIVDAPSARAALAGAYNALQDGSYYGGEFMFYADMLGEDVEHTGTFSDYAAADANRVLPDNESLLQIYGSIYSAVGVANQLIARVPSVPGLSASEADDIIGQAHFIRALAFHDLVKLWGPIQMPLQPVEASEATTLPRTAVAEVYTQILADLAQAESKIQNTGDVRKATPGAVVALRSRVQLHLQNWQAVIDAANSLESSYSLASSYSALFTPDGNDTPEDIFRVAFTAVEFNLAGFYYISRSFGGRWEVAPSVDLINAYGSSWDPTFDPDTVTLDSSFQPGDPRAAWSIAFDASDRNYGTKFPTPIGAEDIHVIRFGEVILNKAEALARRNTAGDLVLAINEVNRIRGRVGAPLLSAVGLTQAQVLALVWRERRLELAMEGLRWPDLVRTGQAQIVLGSTAVANHELLLPIPQAEVDVQPGNFQNPGY